MVPRHAAHFAMTLLLVLAVTGCQTAEVKPTTYELLFCADHAVHQASIAPDGTVQTGRVLDLPEDSVCPIWSPDGQLALPYRFRDERPIIRDSLSLIERGSGIVHELYDLGPRDAEWMFRWLPDGISLLLISARDYQGDEAYCDAFAARSMAGTDCWRSLGDLYLAHIHLPGGIASFERLTARPTNRCDLAWSPDGQKVAYTRGAACQGGLVEPGDIDVLDLPTGDLITLIHGTTAELDPATINYYPQFSPDGEAILYSTWWTNEHTEQLLVTDLQSWETRSVTPKGVMEGYWSPDGKKVMWRTEHTLGVTDVTSGEIREWAVAKDASRLIGPSGWSPDSQYYVWVQWTDQPGESGLYVVDLETAEITIVVSPMAGGFAWSPDGRWLAFADTTPVERDTCDHGYQIGVYIVRPDGTDLYNITQGQGLCALQRPPISWAGYPFHHAAVDVQWVRPPLRR